jgi:hypothetical protein
MDYGFDPSVLSNGPQCGGRLLSILRATGDLLRSGATQTNVNDLIVILVEAV